MGHAYEMTILKHLTAERVVGDHQRKVWNIVKHDKTKLINGSFQLTNQSRVNNIIWQLNISLVPAHYWFPLAIALKLCLCGTLSFPVRVPGFQTIHSVLQKNTLKPFANPRWPWKIPYMDGWKKAHRSMADHGTIFPMFECRRVYPEK